MKRVAIIISTELSIIENFIEQKKLTRFDKIIQITPKMDYWTKIWEHVPPKFSSVILLRGKAFGYPEKKLSNKRRVHFNKICRDVKSMLRNNI